MRFDEIGDALGTDGFVVAEHGLPAPLASRLLARSRSLDGGDFVRAGIGREGDHHVNRFVRGDWVYWPVSEEEGVGDYLVFMERMRLALNRRLFLGLFDFGCHFACYPVGARYQRHVDAFRGDTNRVLSTVLYLNPDWEPADGGELLLYRRDEDVPTVRIVPVYGTMVVFLSEEFPHEVLPARRARYSLTGWFRVNGSVGVVVDPPR